MRGNEKGARESSQKEGVGPGERGGRGAGKLGGKKFIGFRGGGFERTKDMLIR